MSLTSPRFQRLFDGEWVDAENVTPELQVLLKMRLHLNDLLGYPPGDLTVTLTSPQGSTTWRALP